MKPDQVEELRETALFLSGKEYPGEICQILLKAANKIDMQMAELDVMKDRATADLMRLRREIYVLRKYGNKGCTAMADEALSNMPFITLTDWEKANSAKLSKASAPPPPPGPASRSFGYFSGVRVKNDPPPGQAHLSDAERRNILDNASGKTLE